MKKIAFVVNNLAKGGMERVVVILANQLVLLGYSVSVVVTEGRINDEYSDCNAEIIDLTQGHKLKSLLSKSFYLKDILEPFDAVFLNYAVGNKDFSTHPIFQCFLHFSNKTFLVNHNNNSEYHLTTNKKLAHYLLSANQNVVSICNAMQQNMESEYKFNNVKTIYNPINIKDIQSKMNESVEDSINYKYILAVGRFAEQKNFPALVRAYGNSSLVKENVKLVMVGKYNDDTYAREYRSVKSEISRFNLDKYVVFLGERDNPFKYMKNALFLVMSSRFEGFPMVLGECLATGTPVVSYDLQTGPNEIIIHEHNGLLVENQNEQKLTKAIDRLYVDKALYEKCKNNAQDGINKFDVNVVVKEWEALIDKAISQKGSNIIHNKDYVNLHGYSVNNDLALHIINLLNYENLLSYFNEVNYNNLDDFLTDIYVLIAQYCKVFNCKDYQDMIKSSLFVDMSNVVLSSNLIDYDKNRLLLCLSKDNTNENSLLSVMFYIKNDENKKILNNKWYEFGKLEKKLKVIAMIKFLVSSFLNRFGK